MTILQNIENSARNILFLFDEFEKKEREISRVNGPYLVSFQQDVLIQKLLKLRVDLCLNLLKLNKKHLYDLCKLDAVFDASERLRGTLYGQKISSNEQEFIIKGNALFQKDWSEPIDSFFAFVVLSYYNQPFLMKLQKSIFNLPDAASTRYLEFTMRQPHLMGIDDETKYITYYKSLCAWLLLLIQKNKSTFLNEIIKSKLTFGACYYVDCSTKAIIDGRAKIIHEVIKQTPALDQIQKSYKKTPITRTKKRLGILSRNRKSYTDTRALYAMFHGFSAEEYEVYWYSLDNIDDIVLDDLSFEEKLDSLIHKARSLSGDLKEMAELILEDDLDFFVLGTAFSFSVKDLDLLVALPLARIQVNLAALVAGSSGLPNIDYYVVPDAKGNLLALYKKEASENLVPVSGPLLCYERPLPIAPSSILTRDELGVPADAILYASGAALNKLMPETLRCWIKILQKVPHSYLVLFPLNPAWGGYFIATTFFARLRAVLKEFPDIDVSRIKIVRAVTPIEFELLIQLSDIYLGSFPRDGGTAAMQALSYGKPLVARKESWFHTPNDALMLRSIGCDALVAEDNQAYIKLAVKLGVNKIERQYFANQIVSRLNQAPFFNIDEQTKRIQSAFNDMAKANAALMG